MQKGVYNQIVTITADAPQVGQKFAGWQLKDKIVSYDEVYTICDKWQYGIYSDIRTAGADNRKTIIRSSC